MYFKSIVVSYLHVWQMHPRRSLRTWLAFQAGGCILLMLQIVLLQDYLFTYKRGIE